jgi:hypothetical protein
MLVGRKRKRTAQQHAKASRVTRTCLGLLLASHNQAMASSSQQADHVEALVCSCASTEL